MIKRIALFFIVFVSTSVFSVYSASDALAAGTGYVNMNQIYAQSSVIKQLRDEISNDFKTEDERVREAYAELEQLAKEFEKNVITMSDEDKQAAQVELREKDQIFAELNRDLNQKVGARLQELQQKIDPELNRFITKIAREKGFDVVINPTVSIPIPNQPRPQIQNLLLFATDEADITEAVMEMFDKEAVIQ